MTAYHIAQASRVVVVFAKEQGGIRALDRVLEKHLVHRPQQMLRPIEGDRALTAEIRLQIGHQQSSGDPFPRDIADHQRETLLTEIQKIEVIATDFSSLDTNPRIFEGLNGRQRL